ncbi:MAG TPA: hypothetical protein VHW01_23455 [Polyangiaceae bacterium]|nr:hypothetical protein [Polyangiaceae bacterium]
MFVALLHTVVLGAALRVEGETSCPTPAQVAADVQKILGLSDEYAPKVHASLTRDGAFIDLKLSESDGTSLGERRLEANEDCVVLSRTAAVVLGAWLTDQHPEFLVALPASAESSARSGAAPGSNATPPAEKPAPALALAPAEQPEATSAMQPKVRSAWTHRLALGAAIGGGWASSQFVPAAWLGVSLDPVTTGWGAQVSAAWLGAADQSLQGKQVQWTRWPLMAGPYVRFAFGTATVELEAGPALGWLHLEGQNFAGNKGSSHASFGGYGALRFMPKAGAWHPFLMAAPVLWFGHANAETTNPDGGGSAEISLPSVELLFTAGVRLLP